MQFVTTPRGADLQLQLTELDAGLRPERAEIRLPRAFGRAPGRAALDELRVTGNLHGALLLGLGGRR